MSIAKPSDVEFIKWTENDDNVPKIRYALIFFPDLAHIRVKVSNTY